MKKFQVVYAMSYIVEAETPEEAEEKAYELFDQDVERAIQEAGSLDCFGSNVEEIVCYKPQWVDGQQIESI